MLTLYSHERHAFKFLESTLWHWVHLWLEMGTSKSPSRDIRAYVTTSGLLHPDSLARKSQLVVPALVPGISDFDVMVLFF